jgi:hypothetical protein
MTCHPKVVMPKHHKPYTFYEHLAAAQILAWHDLSSSTRKTPPHTIFVHKARNLKFNNQTKDFKHTYPQNL